MTIPKDVIFAQYDTNMHIWHICETNDCYTHYVTHNVTHTLWHTHCDTHNATHTMWHTQCNTQWGGDTDRKMTQLGNHKKLKAQKMNDIV